RLADQPRGDRAQAPLARLRALIADPRPCLGSGTDSESAARWTGPTACRGRQKPARQTCRSVSGRPSVRWKEVAAQAGGGIVTGRARLREQLLAALQVRLEPRGSPHARLLQDACHQRLAIAAEIMIDAEDSDTDGPQLALDLLRDRPADRAGRRRSLIDEARE